MSSLQRRVGLPSDLTPFVCHSVLLIVHLLSFIRAICPAHFHFALIAYWTVSVTLVLYRVMVLQILSFSLTFSIFLSVTHWPVSSFFTNVCLFLFVFCCFFFGKRPCLASKCHRCLNTFLVILMGRCLCTFQKHSLPLSSLPRLLALVYFPLLLFVSDIYSSHLLYFCLVYL